MIEKEKLVLDDTIKQNKQGQPILGVLEGPCADFISCTRNGRLYDEELWEKVFNNEIVKEYFECGGIPGELDHPTDRLETCSEKIAIMMPEPPKKNKDGQLIARFDILDTPNGRIAYTLAKYGYKLGISSRGNGDTYPDYDGNEHVDPNTYDFQAFDLVLLPAVKAARLKMVESLQNEKTFKQALTESLNKATPEERKTMEETLANLKINYKEESKQENFAAEDDGAIVLKDLQESLKQNQKLENQIVELQEKLSVCYAKEAKQEEYIEKYKDTIRGLSEKVSKSKKIESKVQILNENLENHNTLLVEEQKKSSQLLEEQKITLSKNKKLQEALENKNNELTEANKKISKLNKEINYLNESLKDKEESLTEELESVKKDLKIKSSNYNTKLTNANKLVEQYRDIAKKAVDKYIDLQATNLGLEKQEIINKLPQNYSFNDIDMICEKLCQFNLKINSLPFNISKNSKIELQERKESILNNPIDRIDDELDRVDPSLLRLARLQ